MNQVEFNNELLKLFIDYQTKVRELCTKFRREREDSTDFEQHDERIEDSKHG